MTIRKLTIVVLLAGLLATGCAVDYSSADQQLPAVATRVTSQTQSQFSTVTPTPIMTLWVDPDLPQAVRESIFATDQVSLETDKNFASGWMTQLRPSSEGIELFNQIFVLAAAFPTLEDEYTLDQIIKIWKGNQEQHLLVMEEGTYRIFSLIWGKAAESQVVRVKTDQLVAAVWENPDALALLPFDSLDPRLKVLLVDGFNPLKKGLDVEGYPLRSRYGIQMNPDWDQAEINKWKEIFEENPEVINRDESLLTSIVLTGTTALSRNTAFVMEEKGILYPARDIQEWLRDADITHISNEVPMFEGCPPAKPLREEARFCSAPRYIELFDYTGVDVIELTGNHLLDWGAEAFLSTLALYDEKGYAYYGGGKTPEEGFKPLLMEDNGNKIAFLGCNAVGPQQVWASNTQPGPIKCDLNRMEGQISQLKQDGYVVIVTFQHFELDDYRPQSSQRIDFQRVARAGADIVSGSQAHYPQTMTFIGKNFIHYGLGNLFFDQMFAGYEREFLDEHIIYAGSYISTQIHTAMLEDFARPRPMTQEERTKLLEAVFSAAEWNIE